MTRFDLDRVRARLVATVLLPSDATAEVTAIERLSASSSWNCTEAAPILSISLKNVRGSHHQQAPMALLAAIDQWKRRDHRLAEQLLDLLDRSDLRVGLGSQNRDPGAEQCAEKTEAGQQQALAR